jgi:hypothetical protein
MNDYIKEWYMNDYPTDELGCELYDNVTFSQLSKDLGNVYDVIGVGDSLIRERVFTKLSELMNVDYAYIYRQWLNG